VGRGRHCARPGCRAWAMRGAGYCRAHQPVPDDVEQVEDERDRRDRAVEVFRRRLERGNYRELFDLHIAAVIAHADSEGSLADEIGALRLVLARVLAEEEDPARLATSIPHIVDAVVRAVRAQRTLSGAMAEDLTEALTQILLEMGLDEQ
jgi:hypothetical protein